MGATGSRAWSSPTVVIDRRNGGAIKNTTEARSRRKPSDYGSKSVQRRVLE